MKSLLSEKNGKNCIGMKIEKKNGPVTFKNGLFINARF